MNRSAPLLALALLLCLVPLATAQAITEVKVGLLIAEEDDPVSRAVLQGATLAVDEVNRAGGFNGTPFALVTRSDVGPWGSGASQITRLIYEDEVWAILGGLDGQGAHLAQQVVTKAHVALLSPWASDPTLTQINIPWFFRGLPDDRQQAAALVEALYKPGTERRVIAVIEDTYDGRMAGMTFVKAVAAAGHAPVDLLTLPEKKGSPQEVIPQIKDTDVDAVVLFTSPPTAAALAKQLPPEIELYGGLRLNSKVLLQDLSQTVYLISPDTQATPQIKRFRQQHMQQFGRESHLAAAFAYDGMHTLLAAIQQAGLDRARIREAMAESHLPDGVTGPLRFDAAGNRVGTMPVQPARGFR